MDALDATEASWATSDRIQALSSVVLPRIQPSQDGTAKRWDEAHYEALHKQIVPVLGHECAKEIVHIACAMGVNPAIAPRLDEALKYLLAYDYVTAYAMSDIHSDAKIILRCMRSASTGSPAIGYVIFEGQSRLSSELGFSDQALGRKYCVPLATAQSSAELDKHVTLKDLVTARPFAHVWLAFHFDEQCYQPWNANTSAPSDMMNRVANRCGFAAKPIVSDLLLDDDDLHHGMSGGDGIFHRILQSAFGWCDAAARLATNLQDDALTLYETILEGIRESAAMLVVDRSESIHFVEGVDN
eukprot:TRINITY_DN7781_c0_g1_i1.p1 TRINITY_DN7781_c0_g1~~TRINITY_DN7781_c0_g1_i1.p1  ORF type:complete len:309 (+),score=54.80 TRINITY_DN7781_c0_g1_i1:30-929(+)